MVRLTRMWRQMSVTWSMVRPTYKKLIIINDSTYLQKKIIITDGLICLLSIRPT